MANSNIIDVRKAELEKWILENTTFSNKRVTKFIDHLQDISSLNNEASVFEIDDVITLREFRKSIMKTKYFRQLPGIYRSEYILNLDIYEEFLLKRVKPLMGSLLTKNNNPQANVLAAPDNKVKEEYTKTKKADKQSENNAAVFNSNIPIKSILLDEQYQPLINALYQDGISTLGQLIDTNVVIYINSKNIYTWKERLAVWEGLRKIMDPYRKTIEEKLIMQTSNAEVKDIKEQMSSSSDDKGLHKADIRNKKSYINMKPQKFILNGKEFVVTCWIEVLIGVCEELFESYPAKMTALIEQPVGRGERPLFGRNRKWYSKVLKNGLSLDARHSSTSVLNSARAVCIKCGIDPEELEVFVEKEESIKLNIKIQEQTEPHSVVKEEKNSEVNNSTKLLADIAGFIKDCGLNGCSLSEIQSHVQLNKTTIVKQITENTKIVAIDKDKYIYRDCIVDIDEAAATIMSILAAHFQQFYGYSSNRLLYDAARIDLALFLNDNDFDNIDKIYYLAKHLFSKEKFSVENYIFYGNMHIWQQEPDYPKSVKGLLVHYARIVQNTVSFEECENHLRKLGLSATNLKQQMQITQDRTFLQYDGAKCLLAEALRIDELWISSIIEGLDKLFEDNEYVVSRDIQKEWYETLPALPFGLQWTRLLLQDIIGYFPEVGYRTISALAGQSSDTIHAAIVPEDSFIGTFADFVMTFLVDKNMPSQRYTADELRLLLRQHGVIAGNELYWTMHKALDDYRFAWDNENKTVLVNMG